MSASIQVPVSSYPIANGPFAVARASAGTEKWYAIVTRARNERSIVNRLQERGMETFLPTVTEVHQWRDRRKRVEMPLFSCYVFVKLELTNEQRYRVCNIEGVFGFVGVRGDAIAIPEEQIDAVRTLMTQQLSWSSHPFLKIGQRVRIRGGALDGVEGVLQGRNGDRTLVISIDAIQRSLAVRVEGYDVQPI
ncbi:MAG TPA: UpxY family transcription antiterminator [Terriglobales bacterium]|nr:UpxY family transcription antiterminator [Terriglobales bacterium]